jgi:hypothetical protein
MRIEASALRRIVDNELELTVGKVNRQDTHGHDSRPYYIASGGKQITMSRGELMAVSDLIDRFLDRCDDDMEPPSLGSGALK